MRAVIQRVSKARVLVDGRVHAEIGRGLVVLVGVEQNDGDSDAEALSGKIADLRIFEDDEGRMNRSVRDVGGAVLLVSQFTLLGDCRKGRRPSFAKAAPAEPARRLYEGVVRQLRDAGVDTATGVFQTTMSVELSNEGPVTLLVDTTRAF